MDNWFLDFFKVGTDSSMLRLITFLCAVSAFIFTIGAIYLQVKESLSGEYSLLCIGLWSAAFGGKTWSKQVELNKKKSS